MILCLYGQPGSGKTTLARAFMERYYVNMPSGIKDFYHIDGDMLREVTRNNDYTRQGRLANCMLANQIAMYSEVLGYLPVLSIVHPYGEGRLPLMQAGACLIFLKNAAKTPSGKARFALNDFEEYPYMHIVKTGASSVNDSLQAVMDIYNRHVNRIAT